MRRATWGGVVAALLITAPTGTQAQVAELTSEAESFLFEALDTLESVVLGRDTIRWGQVRDSARLRAFGARKPADTYGAIQWALRRVNAHSFLQIATPGAVTEVVDGRIGYVRVPQRGGAAVALADSLHAGVGELAEAGVCGWIVDLRSNGGGNMWPMLAGVGPLLGDSVVGAFGADEGAGRWYYRSGVSGVLHPDNALDTVTRVTVGVAEDVSIEQAVAVLMDGRTASSGEATAVAFRGRPNTRFFGEDTSGYATVNRGARLSNGANMVVTTGYYADRLGRAYPETLNPDEEIESFPARGRFPPIGWRPRLPAGSSTRLRVERGSGGSEVAHRPIWVSPFPTPRTLTRQCRTVLGRILSAFRWHTACA